MPKHVEMAEAAHNDRVAESEAEEVSALSVACSHCHRESSAFGARSRQVVFTGELAMIRAMMFDLDDVVVQSEKLKAQAYAMAVQRQLLAGCTSWDGTR